VITDQDIGAKVLNHLHISTARYPHRPIKFSCR